MPPNSCCNTECKWTYFPYTSIFHQRLNQQDGKKKNTLSMLSLSPFLYLFQTLKAIRAFVQITVPHINISSVGPLLGIWVPPLKS